MEKPEKIEEAARWEDMVRQTTFGMLLPAIACCNYVVLATSPIGAPDEDQIREAALSALDFSRPLQGTGTYTIFTQSDFERQFAAELIQTGRAEQDMVIRAAIAVTGSEQSEVVLKLKLADAATPKAIQSARPVINGDSAVLALDPGVGSSTTLDFRKTGGRWQVDFLKSYRENGWIDSVHLAKLHDQQRAADAAAGIYERKEEHDLNAVPLIYETMYQQIWKHDPQTQAPPPSSQPEK